jgi:hypothetical protein
MDVAMMMYYTNAAVAGNTLVLGALATWPFLHHGWFGAGKTVHDLHGTMAGTDYMAHAWSAIRNHRHRAHLHRHRRGDGAG